MKTLFSALALLAAAPIAAQSAPAADPHAGHKQGTGGGSEHKEHGGKHDMDCCKKGCCDKMKQHAKGEKMGCCAEGGKAPAGEHKGH